MRQARSYQDGSESLNTIAYHTTISFFISITDPVKFYVIRAPRPPISERSVRHQCNTTSAHEEIPKKIASSVINRKISNESNKFLC